MNGYTADSFSQIYTSLYKRSFYFTKSYVHDDLVAEDITSESLIKLWERLKESPVAQEAVLPLLLTILKHKSLDYLKHREVELRNKEIAEVVGLSVKSVEYHIGKALKVLRVSLKDYLPLFYLLFYY